MSSIKSKIITGVAAVVLIALLIGLGFTYVYIRMQMREQILADNKVRLVQSSYMMEYISNDILNLTRNMVTDEILDLQNIRVEFDSVAEEVNAVDKIVCRLQDYISMREFIQSIALVDKDGTVLWDKAPFDQYFSNLMKAPWYTQSITDGQNYRFTGKHSVNTLWIEEPVISLIAVKINPYQMQVTGEVIVNVRFRWLENAIQSSAESFDGFCWLCTGGEILLQQGDIDVSVVQSILQSEQEQSGIYPFEDGYLLTNYTASNEWTFASYVSDRSIDALLFHIPLLFLSMGFISVAGIVFTVNLIIRRIVRPVNDLVSLMVKAGAGDLTVHADILTNDEMSVLGEGFNHMIQQLDEYITLKMDHERQIRQQEYGLILARLNPHFIYNTLNTVVYLANRDGSEDSAKVVESLIVLLQDIIKISDDSDYSTVAQELTVVRHYCLIQQYRYPGKFTLTIDVPDDLQTAVIPKTILQPLVENALLHGIFPTDREGKITVYARLKEPSVLELGVRDDGDGMDVEKVEILLQEQGNGDAARHVGLSSIAERIHYMYGAAYGLQFESRKNTGTEVRLILPLRN